MINVPLTQVDRGVIEALITNEVRESRSLDYKDKLPSGKNDDRKEFLADVSAMANAGGGDIVFGIAERREDGRPTGLPESVSGLGGVNLDAESLRLENMIRDGIDPRISGLRLWPVEGIDGGPVLVLRVPKSYLAPHMVKTGDSRSYSRNNSGKYPLDVTEIRSAFALSETLPEKIRRFRDERIGRIVADELPVPLPAHPKTVLHLLPLSALDPTTRIDVAPLLSRSSDFPPMSLHHLHSWGPRYNLDGLLLTGNSGNPVSPSSYLQLFRSGAVEAVESLMLRSQRERESGLDPLISAMAFENALIVDLDRFLRLLELVRVEPPVVVMLSLIGVKGYRLFLPNRMIDNVSHYQIDRDTLHLPEGLMQSFGEPADKLLQTAFDAIWQCVGYERDTLYQYGGKGRWSSGSDGNPPIK
jgi:hypothetical protein